MLNAPTAPPDDAALRVFDGVELPVGCVNVPDAVLLEQIASAIRRGHPQVRPDPPKYERICLVGGGPSLADTFDELKQLLFEGAILVTVNGAYHWCLARNLRPQVHIVMDARESNARFVEPAVPQCRYVLASQCHPATFDAVEGRDNVWIFHAAAGGDEAVTALLDTFYAGQWVGVGGGSTVATRAVSLLRTLGYLRFDLFGVDSCWLDDVSHAYAQPENAADERIAVRIRLKSAPLTAARTFICAGWHVKQAEDFLQMVRATGDHFLLHVHGNGLLAHMLTVSADASIETGTLTTA